MNKYLVYANSNAVKFNPIACFFYIISYPIAIIFCRMGLKPNDVTFASLFLCVFAVIGLINGDKYLYTIFWLVAYVFDYVDGSMARLSKSIGLSALRLDHTVDQIKIILIFMGFGIYYDTQAIWILSFLAASCFLFYTTLNHELSWVRKIKSANAKRQGFDCDLFLGVNKKNIKSEIKHWPDGAWAKKIWNLKSTFFTTFFNINGHTLIIFFAIPFDVRAATFLLTYFFALSFLRSLQLVFKLSECNKVNL